MKYRKRITKYLVEIARVIVGGTFLFSGFVKAVDPLGFTYKIQDYLIELNFTELFPLALPAAVIMVVAEFFLGALLLLGIYRKWVTRLITLFMLFFTPLTLWIAIANPVEDCGCFGDALVISNWETFYKNCLLLAATILLIVKWKLITPLFSPRGAPYAALFIALFGVLFALYNIYRLPILDFRPYKIGANIPELMNVDPEKADIYETIFIYSKEGVEQEFTEENYPWDDSTWVFVVMKMHLVKEGEKPAIEDFALEALYYDDTEGSWGLGGDITDLVLLDTSYTFLMVSFSLDEMNIKNIERFKEVGRYAREHEYPFYLLTASAADVVGKWEKQHDTGFQLCHADERALKTMIRANPGLILIKEGRVINKWDDKNVPRLGSSSGELDDTGLVQVKDPLLIKWRKLLVIALLFFVPLLFIKWRGRRLEKIKE